MKKTISVNDSVIWYLAGGMIGVVAFAVVANFYEYRWAVLAWICASCLLGEIMTQVFKDRR